MAKIDRDLRLSLTKEETEGFVIPEGWYSSFDQWPTRTSTIDLFNSKEYGCAGCTKADDCGIRKAVCRAMGEDYPIFPKDWLTIAPEGLDAWSPRPRILCRLRPVCTELGDEKVEEKPCR